MKKLLILTQIVYVLFAVPWLIIWGLTFMSFDAGFSYGALALVACVGLYPVAAIVCAILAWVFRRRRPRAAAIVGLIPMLWVLGIGIPVAIINLT